MKLAQRFFKQKTCNSIYSRKTFHDLFERERDRSLRNGNSFSLLIMKNANGGSPEHCAELIRTLQKRIRNIDDLGWFDNEYIGVILPETTYDGADKLAADIRTRMGHAMDQPLEYNIFTYPEKKRSGSDGDRRFSRPDDRADVPELAAVLGKPMPSWKRALDITGAALALILLLPLLLIIAIYIKTVSPGPVFFRQQRLGYMKKPFVCWKFRTMKVDADGNKHRNHVADLIRNGKQLQKIDDEPDASIIAYGNVLRKLGLDELPQLVNVLRGEMSLIGPRPCLEYEAVEFLDWQNMRFDIHPGLTGLWQVSGKNRTTFEEMMRFDINYSKKRSLFRDMFIFIKTIPAIIDQATENIKLKRKIKHETTN